MHGSVVVVGRVSIDLYARESGASFRNEQSFNKSVGGSPTNVAVAAARLGHRVTLLTKVGGDELGQYVTDQLATWGVDISHIGFDRTGLTPVVLAAMDPPEEPRVIWHRGVDAPDTKLVPADLPEGLLNDCDVFWMTGGTLARGTTAQAAMHWLQRRQRRTHTILDIDFRPTFWSSVDEARQATREAITHSTVVVGNRGECEMAVGTDDPDRAADELLHRGVSLAVVKLGADGVLLASTTQRVRIAPLSVKVVCGLGSGDAFGGALINGLINGWQLDVIGEYANAAGALVASRLACADAMPTIDELNVFVAAHARHSK